MTNTIFLNKIPYLDVPYFITRESTLLKYNWNIVQQPRNYILSYSTHNTISKIHNYIMRTPEGFYYNYRIVIPLFRNTPYQYLKSPLYPTLQFLYRDYPVHILEGNVTPILPLDVSIHVDRPVGIYPLDTFSFIKRNLSDIPITIWNREVLYRTKEGYYYTSNNNTLVPSLDFIL